MGRLLIGFCIEGVTKTTFHICWESVDFSIMFTCFLMASGSILMIFGVLEAGLKLDDFRWLFHRGPELRAHGRFLVFALSLGPIATKQQHQTAGGPWPFRGI